MLVSSWRMFVQAKTSYLRVEKMLDENPVKQTAASPASIQGPMKWQNLGATVPGKSEPILEGLTAEFKEGQVIAIAGHSGAGKTTLFNAICGIVEPTSGKLTLNGKPHDWPATHELTSLGISRTLQGVGLFPDLTVTENVMIGAQHLAQTGLISAALGRNRKDEDQIRNKARVALERVYAGGIAHRRADTLSYPDTKRVAIARALVSEPTILMLDEPAGGLGTQDIEWMNLLIRNLSASMSVLLIEHHMDVVMSVCSKLYVLNFGEVIASGNAETVRRDPAVMAAYLGTGAK